jgi:3-isopropylmalate dehydrogenase
MKANLVLLPGDGIGPEIVSATAEVLQALARKFKHELSMQEYLIGGIAMDQFGVPLPDETLQACQKSDAILLGAVGGPKWDDPKAALRPEQGLLGARKALALFGNLRPVKVYPYLLDASPLRPERLEGVDLLVVRELTGGLYFGQPKERRTVNGEEQAIDSMTYTVSEIERVARLAFELAGKRRGKCPRWIKLCFGMFAFMATNGNQGGAGISRYHLRSYSGGCCINVSNYKTSYIRRYSHRNMFWRYFDRG